MFNVKAIKSLALKVKNDQTLNPQVLYGVVRYSRSTTMLFFYQIWRVIAQYFATMQRRKLFKTNKTYDVVPLTKR